MSPVSAPAIEESLCVAPAGKWYTATWPPPDEPQAGHAETNTSLFLPMTTPSAACRPGAESVRIGATSPDAPGA